MFQITRPFKSNLAIFWEFGNLTQYAKNLVMVIFVPLLLVIFMPSSLGFGFVSALSDTNGQIGSDGDPGVAVGMVVLVNVKIGVCGTDPVGVGVLVGGRGVRVAALVSVGVRVTVPEGVIVGSTTSV